MAVIGYHSQHVGPCKLLPKWWLCPSEVDGRAGGAREVLKHPLVFPLTPLPCETSCQTQTQSLNPLRPVDPVSLAHLPGYLHSPCLQGPSQRGCPGVLFCSRTCVFLRGLIPCTSTPFLAPPHPRRQAAVLLFQGGDNCGPRGPKKQEAVGRRGAEASPLRWGRC